MGFEDLEEEVWLCLEVKHNTDNCIFLYEELGDSSYNAKYGKILFVLDGVWWIATTFSSMMNGSCMDYEEISGGDYIKKIRDFEINRILN